MVQTIKDPEMQQVERKVVGYSHVFMKEVMPYPFDRVLGVT
jgi:hypothetical protein